MLKWGKLEIGAGFWVLVGAVLVIGAGEVMPLVAMAALCHELGHLGALYLADARVERLRLSLWGAEIRADTRYLPYGKEICCTLAGPMVNLALALVLARVSGDYLLAGANLLQGVYNLLPLPGLDGGRALHLCISSLTDPAAADGVCRWVSGICALLMTGAALTLILRHGTGLFLLPTALGGLVSAFFGEKRQLPLAKVVKRG